MIYPIAYVGPGAGFAFLGSFLTILIAFVLSAVSILIWPFRALWRLASSRLHRRGKPKIRKLIFLGLDGLDPGLVEKFMAAGDIVTARMIFERAAQSEDATAALALAAAYDPLVLSKLGVLGMDGSPERARIWYVKAESLGSTQAVARLKALENR